MYSSEDLLRLTGKLWAPILCSKRNMTGNIRLQDDLGRYCGNIFYFPSRCFKGRQNSINLVMGVSLWARIKLREKLHDQGSSTFSPVLRYPL